MTDSQFNVLMAHICLIIFWIMPAEYRGGRLSFVALAAGWMARCFF